MFKIKANPTFDAIVVIPSAGGSEQELPITFKHKTRKELAMFNDKVQKAQGNGDDKEAIDLLESLIENWKADADFNRKNLEVLLDQYPPAYSLIYSSYLKELMGAKRGN